MSDTDLPRRFSAFDSLTVQFGASGSLPLLFASDLFHRGPLVGRGLPASLGMFEEAIDISPGGTPAPAYDHLVWGKTRLGDRDAAHRWLGRGRGCPPTSRARTIVDFLKLGYDLRWGSGGPGSSSGCWTRFDSDATVETRQVLPLQRRPGTFRGVRTRSAG